MIMANRRKLTMEIATSIRHLYKDLEYTQQQLANIFCVSRYVIRQILYNITYSDADYNPSEVPDTPLLKHYNKYVKNHYLYHDMKYDECFKTIDGFPRYKICVDGTIFSDVGFHYTKVQSSINSNGYPYVNLVDNNKRHSKRIHTLLAEHFLDNVNNLPYVLHRDDDKTNNSLTNLYFGTKQDNGNDMVKNGKYIRRIPDFTRNEINNTIKVIPTISNTELSRRFGVSMSSIKKIRSDFSTTSTTI